MKKVSLFFFIFIIILCCYGCTEKEQPEEKKHYISFICEDPTIEKIEWNDSTKLPELQKEGYLFKGWYTDTKLTREFNLTSTKKNIDLYPKWEEIVKKIKIIVDNEVLDELTIKFTETYLLDEYLYISDGYKLVDIKTKMENNTIEYICNKEYINNLILVTKKETGYEIKLLNPKIVGFYFEIKAKTITDVIECRNNVSYYSDNTQKIIQIIYSSDVNVSSNIFVCRIEENIDIENIQNSYAYYLDDDKVIQETSLQTYIIK